MKLNNVTVNMMVKNEEAYIRQAIRSIVPYVDRFIVFDTGSTDNTIKYILELYREFPQIELHQVNISGDSINWNGNHLSQELTDVRNTMIDLSETDWILQLDGDEIWPKRSVEKLCDAIKILEAPNNKWVQGLMVKIRWCISNLEYTTPGPFYKTLRLFRNTGKWISEFPNEFYHIDGRPITMNDPRCLTLDDYFLHMSMYLRPERREINGEIDKLSEEDTELLIKVQYAITK